MSPFLSFASSRGRPATTYIDTLRRDNGLINTGEIRALMINSDLW